MKRVLLAYARWNKTVGYCQGFNVIAALILQVMDRSEEDALKVKIRGGLQVHRRTLKYQQDCATMGSFYLVATWLSCTYNSGSIVMLRQGILGLGRDNGLRETCFREKYSDIAEISNRRRR